MPEGEDKTYPATPRRRQEARKQGNVAKSPEFATSATLLAMIMVLHYAIPGPGGMSLIGNTRQAFTFDHHNMVFDMTTVRMWQMIMLTWIGRLILPATLVTIIVGLAVNVGQVGFYITPEALSPKWNRINPLEGMKRLLSIRGSVELIKGIAKMAIVGCICYTVIRNAIEDGTILSSLGMPLTATLANIGSIIWTIGIRVAIALFILAIADYAFQKYDFEKNIKMSISEIKQEMKDTDGDPQTKSRIRRIQREMSRRRMMQQVPKADVVITNPTHYAVALVYKQGSAAPKVVAKGRDLIAQQIKDIARQNNVPIVENVELARSLYATVELDRDIPGELYEAVAKVLAFVYKTYGKRVHA